MWAHSVVVLDVFGKHAVKVLFAEEDEVPETFLLDGAHETFHEGVHVWGADGGADRGDAQRSVINVFKPCVVVMNEIKR